MSVTFLNLEFVGYGLLLLLLGLVVRLLVTYVCVWTTQFTHAERTFISMAWLPKATVQAAIGSVALDVVKGGTCFSCVSILSACTHRPCFPFTYFSLFFLLNL